MSKIGYAKQKNFKKKLKNMKLLFKYLYGRLSKRVPTFINEANLNTKSNVTLSKKNPIFLYSKIQLRIFFQNPGKIKKLITKNFKIIFL